MFNFKRSNHSDQNEIGALLNGFYLNDGATDPEIDPRSDQNDSALRKNQKGDEDPSSAELFIERGLYRASESSGSSKSFALHLNHIYQTSFDKVRTEGSPYSAKRTELSNANIHLESQSKRLSDEAGSMEKEAQTKIELKKQKIEALKGEINQILGQPKSLLQGEDDYDPLGFALGCVIQLFLTAWLFLFYASASYTAFFSNAGEAINRIENGGDLSILFNSVFNAKAFSEASASPFTLLMILMFAFIFLGLGFLIHKFLEVKKHAAAAALLLLTLVFDGLLAYQITSKLHELQYLAGLAEWRWTPALIWRDSSFYLVIFSGFVVYVIWGVLLHFVMEEYKKRNPVRLAVWVRKQQIKEQEKNIDQIEKELEERRRIHLKQKSIIERKIDSNKIEMAKLAKLMNFKFVPWEEIEKRLDAFTIGWLNYLVHLKQKEREDEINGILKEFKEAKQKGSHHTFIWMEGAS